MTEKINNLICLFLGHRLPKTERYAETLFQCGRCHYVWPLKTFRNWKRLKVKESAEQVLKELKEIYGEEWLRNLGKLLSDYDTKAWELIGNNKKYENPKR